MRHAIVFGDSHIPHHDPSVTNLIWRYHKHAKPDISIHIGDLGDLGMFSRHSKQYVEKYSFTDFMRATRAYLAEWHSVTRRIPKYLIKGNHDHWGERYTANINPQLDGVFNIANLFMDEFRKYRITFVEFDQQRDFFIGPINIHHGSYCGAGHVRQHLRNNPTHQMYGHVHKNEMGPSPAFSQDRKFQAVSVGCSCRIPAKWNQGRPDDWQHGVGDIWFDGTERAFSMYATPITRGRAILHGRMFDGK